MLTKVNTYFLYFLTFKPLIDILIKKRDCRRSKRNKYVHRYRPSFRTALLESTMAGRDSGLIVGFVVVSVKTSLK